MKLDVDARERITERMIKLNEKYEFMPENKWIEKINQIIEKKKLKSIDGKK
jgi:hypothetical protein